MKDMTMKSLFTTTYTYQTFKGALTKYLKHIPSPLQKSKVAQYSHNSTPNVIKILSQIVKAIIRCSPSLDFSFGVRISMIGHFYRQNVKTSTFRPWILSIPSKLIFRYLTLNMSFQTKNRLAKNVKTDQVLWPFRESLQ